MSVHSTNLLASALTYAARGWRVVPTHIPITTPTGVSCSCGKGPACPHKGKHPRTQHGFNDASTERSTITGWWKKGSTANVGIATGAGSSLFVLDVDPKNGGDATLKALEERHGPLPTTVRVNTGGGGLHVYFQHPGFYVTSKIGTVLGKGLDLRGDGAFVVAPPSAHASGGRYRWVEGCSPEEMSLAPAPDWLLSKIRAESDAGKTRSGKAKACYRVTEVQSIRDTEEQSNRRPSSTLSLCNIDVFPDVDSAIAALGLNADASAVLRELLAKYSPQAPGQRRNCIFNIARGLKFHPVLGDRLRRDYVPLIRVWHHAVKASTSQSKSADDSVFDFEHSWETAAVPLGRDPAALAFAAAAHDPPPRLAAQAYTDPKRHILAAACRRLQLAMGATPFSISSRQVAKGLQYAGENPAQFGSRLVSDLAHRGILQIERQGVPGPGGPETAGRYLYVADDLHDEGPWIADPLGLGLTGGAP